MWGCVARGCQVADGAAQRIELLENPASHSAPEVAQHIKVLEAPVVGRPRLKSEHRKVKAQNDSKFGSRNSCNSYHWKMTAKEFRLSIGQWCRSD